MKTVKAISKTRAAIGIAILMRSGLCLLALLQLTPALSYAQIARENELRLFRKEIAALRQQVFSQRERLEVLEARFVSNGQDIRELQCELTPGTVMGPTSEAAVSVLKTAPGVPPPVGQQQSLLEANQDGTPSQEQPVPQPETELDSASGGVTLPQMPSASSASESQLSSPIDLSGYFSTRFLNDTTPSTSAFQAHVVSIFFGKTIGKWRFHSEVEYEFAPKFEATGAGFATSRGEIDIETAWLNYTHQDLL